MRLAKLRGGCNDAKTCPAVYAADRTDQATLVVQGYVITDPQALAQLDLRPGEVAVEVPAGLLGGDPEQRTTVVRGRAVTDPEALAQLDLPPGEAAVEILAELPPGGLRTC